MKTTFKTLKAPLLLAATFSALSINVLAETYTVQVELNSTVGETPLTATQTQAMNYPVLNVDQATKEGSMCVANSKANEIGFDGQPTTNANSLCPGDTALYATVQFKGVPNAMIYLERSINTQDKNGVRFAHWDGQSYQYALNTTLPGETGSYNFNLWSSVTLLDKSQVTDAVMEFTYDISGAYQ